MATITKRIIQQMGTTSCGVTLPVGWINYNKLKPGDTLILIEENNVITIKLSRNKGVITIAKP